jgi:predicted acylesterase/phospholipase RssA
VARAVSRTWACCGRWSEAGIPIDLIGGNSMGALIASQWTPGPRLGRDPRADQSFARERRAPDPADDLAAVGTAHAAGICAACSVAGSQIDALWRPFFAAACNLSRACTTVLDERPAVARRAGQQLAGRPVPAGRAPR